MSKDARKKIIQQMLLAVCLVTLSAFAVFSISCQAPTTTPTPTPTTEVNISSFAFAPASITIAPGSTVTWTNKDIYAHTVTSDTGLFDSGSLIPNATFDYTFNDKGTFAYHCGVHLYMTATVIVD